LQSLSVEAFLVFASGPETKLTEGKKKRLQSQVLIKQSTCTKSKGILSVPASSRNQKARQMRCMCWRIRDKALFKQVAVGFLFRTKMQALSWNN